MALRDDRQIHQIFQSKDAKFYNHDLVREIETFRKTFNGVLFIDRVLGALGLAKGKIYPPRGEDGLKSLHAHITSSTLSSHHKLSILYYLLLDHDDAVAGGGDSARSHSHSHSRSSSQRQRQQQHHDLLAEPFAASSGLPRKYAILMKGLWHMDRGQFPLALEHLAHPSLATTPEFADDIVSVLVRHASTSAPPPPSSSLQGSQDGDGDGDRAGAAADYSLALAYFHTVRPVLRDPEALGLLFGAVAATSVTEALYFSRSYPPPARRQLFEQLVASVVEDSTGHGGGRGGGGRSGSPSSSRRSELVSLAFDDVEDGWFRQYLGFGEGKKLKDARQVLALRRALHQDMGV